MHKTSKRYHRWANKTKTNLHWKKDRRKCKLSSLKTTFLSLIRWSPVRKGARCSTLFLKVNRCINTRQSSTGLDLSPKALQSLNHLRIKQLSKKNHKILTWLNAIDSSIVLNSSRRKLASFSSSSKMLRWSRVCKTYTTVTVFPALFTIQITLNQSMKATNFTKRTKWTNPMRTYKSSHQHWTSRKVKQRIKAIFYC